MPRLTIGVPAYKNAATIRVAVESLLAQTFGDFSLLISDDDSPDDTREVCRELSRLDQRIEYVRQPVNLRYQNFGYLLRRARTEYFMWAAGDDRWAPGFAAACIAELDAHPGIVLATSRVRFEHAGKPVRLARGTYPLLGSQRQNLLEFFSGPEDNSRMYGVFRTGPGQRSFPERSFHAYDWAFSAGTLRFGGHAEIADVLMFRDETPSVHYIDMVRADSANALDRIFPLRRMTGWLFANGAIPPDARALGALFALNVDKHIEYVERFHPAYLGKMAGLDSLWRNRLRWLLVKARE